MTDFILPPLFRLRQPFDKEELSEVAPVVLSALSNSGMATRVRPGMQVAVTVGSRGIDRLPEVLLALMSWLRERGAQPFLLAAMGSHGGGTAEGRRAVLKELGISEEAMGAELVCDGETVIVGEALGLPVHCSARALQADGIVVVNRIKPHTSYHGNYESGLCKMLVVGLGQEKGASVVHSHGIRQVPALVPAMAEVILERAPVLFGLALLENSLNRLKKIVVLPAEEFLSREPKLLEEARASVARLPFAAADVLVVDYLGKDISGTGMDTSVIGRLFIAGEPEPESPRIKRIVALRLSPKSAGSAYGIGLADVTTRALVSALDPEITRANALASTFLERARLPLAFPSDKEAILAAIKTCGEPEPDRLKIARIRDTLHLETLLVSRPLLDSLSSPPEVIAGPLDWEFDHQGNFPL